MDVVFLFGEGAEGVGVVDDGFASSAPVEKVVRRAVKGLSVRFHLSVVGQCQSINKSEVLYVYCCQSKIVNQCGRRDHSIR